MTKELNRLEREVIEKLLVGQHPILEALRKQLSTCRVTKRESSGYGFFSELSINRTTEVAPTRCEELRLGDVDAEIPGLKHGAGFVLFVRAGYLDMLEGYSFDEPWTAANVPDFVLRYTDGKRDMSALDLDQREPQSRPAEEE